MVRAMWPSSTSIAAAQLAWKACSTSRMSSGSSFSDIGVEPTRSTNITVIWRRSAARLAPESSLAAGRGPGCVWRNPVNARTSRLRSPRERPSSLRSASVSSSSTSQSTPLSTKRSAWLPRPMPDSHVLRSEGAPVSMASLQATITSGMSTGASAPAGLLTEVDAQRGLGDDLVRQHRVRRMEAAATGVAEDPLELAGLEHAGAAGHAHGGVDDLPARLDRVVLGGAELGRPQRAMVDASAPFGRDMVEMRGDRLQRELHVGDVFVRHEGAFQVHVVTARGAHAERVPVVVDAVILGVARHEGMDDLGLAVVHPHRVQAVAGPDRAEATEHLVAGDAEAARDLLGRGGREQDRQVVAALGVAGGEDLARHRLA